MGLPQILTGLSHLQVEAVVLSFAFFVLIVAALIHMGATRHCHPSNIRDSIYKFLFLLSFIAQLILRVVFMILSVAQGSNTIPMPEGPMSDFYNTFPASVNASLCTFLLLQWIKASSTTYVPFLVLYVILNALMYISTFVIFGIGGTRWTLYAFVLTYSAMWLSLSTGMIYFIGRTHPWHDFSREWTQNKKPILRGFGFIAACLVLRTALLLLGALYFGDTFTFSTHRRPIPMYLCFIYYGVGEISLCIAMLVVQHYLPSNLRGPAYGELEKLIQKYQINTEQQGQEDKYTCKICMEREIDTALLECSHFVVCSECAINLSHCPICTAPISQRRKLYRS